MQLVLEEIRSYLFSFPGLSQPNVACGPMVKDWGENSFVLLTPSSTQTDMYMEFPTDLIQNSESVVDK